MATEGANRILGQLRLALLGSGSGLSDGQLIAQFAATRDEAAFTALVRRHGPMVLNVCQRVLRHTQDAEDAFQATFVVLARKAASLPHREGVASWLYSVAYRAALETRSMNNRKRARERQADPLPDLAESHPEQHEELIELLDRELSRLPDKYRLPVVLCELEGRPRREVAHQLGLPEGTLSSRLATARKLLANRLAKYNPLFSATAITAALSDGASASVPAMLVSSTVRATTGTIPAVVTALTQGVMKAMLLAKLRAVTWCLVIVASVGVVGFSYHLQRADAQNPDGSPLEQTNRGGDAQKGKAAQGADPRGAGRSADATTLARDEIEALRLEIEALRRSLNATRERVRVLEERPVANSLIPKGDVIWDIGSGNFMRRSDINGPNQLADYYNRMYSVPPKDDAKAEVARRPTDEQIAAAKRASDQAQLKLIEAAIQTLKKDPADQAAAKQIERALQNLRKADTPPPGIPPASNQRK